MKASGSLVSKSAHASPVWPDPVQALIESQLQKMRMLGFADVSRPIWVTSTWPGTSFAPWTSTWVPPV